MQCILSAAGIKVSCRNLSHAPGNTWKMLRKVAAATPNWSALDDEAGVFNYVDNPSSIVDPTQTWRPSKKQATLATVNIRELECVG